MCIPTHKEMLVGWDTQSKMLLVRLFTLTHYNIELCTGTKLTHFSDKQRHRGLTEEAEVNPLGSSNADTLYSVIK